MFVWHTHCETATRTCPVVLTRPIQVAHSTGPTELHGMPSNLTYLSQIVQVLREIDTCYDQLCLYLQRIYVIIIRVLNRWMSFHSSTFKVVTSVCLIGG